MWRVLIEHVPIEHVPIEHVPIEHVQYKVFTFQYKVFTFNTKFLLSIQSFYFLIVTLLTSAVKSVSSF